MFNFSWRQRLSHLLITPGEQQHWPFGLLFSTVVLNFVVFLFLAEPYAFQQVFWLAIFGVSLTGLAFWYWHWSMRVTTHLLLVQAAVLIYYSACVTGGLFSSSLIWLMVLPVPAVLLLGWRDSMVWIVLVIVSILSLIPLTENGWLPVSFVYTQQHVAWSLGNYVFTAVSLLGGLLFYHRIYLNQLAEINSHNQELSEARAALLNAESYKDQFLASVGHELRTPMNAILGFNDVIRHELADDPEGLQTVALVRESTEHLLKLVNQILDFSQLQAGRMHLQFKPTRLRDAFNQCVVNFTPAPGSPVQFRARLSKQLPEWINTDALHLKEVLCHLIDNAFKFTSAGVVQLNIKRDGTYMVFEIKDSGVGIDPELQAFIFNRFEHADQETQRQFGGAGLGLAICKGLVQLFGGDIGMQSEPGKGSLFWFRVPLLPCDPPQSHETQPANDGNGHLYPWRLLLVDDNPVNLKVAAMLCQQIWPLADIQCVNSGQACLAALATHTVDAVLMDLIMPDMDGLQTTQALRSSAQAGLDTLPVIGLTASSHPNDHAACLQAGMNDVLVKPLNKDLMKVCIERWLVAQEDAHG
jgi:signal transduction histidine kinase/CheY-like chemotaxis protein